MEQWFVYLILSVAIWLLYIGYRLRRESSRSGEKDMENGFGKAVAGT